MLEYKTLYEISTLLNSEQDIHTLIRLAVDKVVETTQAQRGVLLVQDSYGDFIFECARNSDKTDIQKPDSEISRTIIQSVLDSGESQILGNALHDPNLSTSESVRSLSLLSIACAPLKIDNETFGVIYIDNRSLAALFDENTRLLLDELSKIISVPLKNSLSRQQLLEKQRQLKHQLDEQKGYDQIIGASPAINKVLELVDQVAGTDATVLIIGESGTGKELFARRLHQKSTRADKEMVILDCSTIADNLLESELFGHEKGAFTGADRAKPGWFEIADKSTIFLDEIGEMSPPAQKKLLRLIQFGEFTPVGSKKTKKVDVRIVTATNKDLPQMVKDGTFREDLYYRINVFELHIPPLRQRRDDIMKIADYFTRRFAHASKKKISGFSDDAIMLLKNHSYPGNIRELRNIIHYAVILCQTETIRVEHLPIEKSQLHPALTHDTTFKTAKQTLLEQFDKEFLTERLRETKGNITQAAKNAGMYKKNFIEKMKLYRIRAKDIDKPNPQ
ncbi:sigma 54-interacting transcriptional regulator [candidate division KSB1 bacterium]|nr:sigma 54-interacting transcriptional regulator [candidate division KSB1 bacterium]